jgi:hypothetical protein
MAEITTDEFTERAMCRVLDSAEYKEGESVAVVLPSADTILAVCDEIERDDPCLICGKVFHIPEAPR